MNRVNVSVRCLGSGDAFGSGGRNQACYCVESKSACFLIDCGATSLTAMKRFRIDPGSIDIVLISHLHGDHFGGLPFLLRETQIMAARRRPLLVAGPAGLEERVNRVWEEFFPGALAQGLSFDLEFIELQARQPTPVGALTVTSYPVSHKPHTEPSALRVCVEDKLVAYSGDTEWTESLIDAAGGVDLFICEAFTYQQEKKAHLNYLVIRNHINELTCKHIVLTHMSDEMLGHIYALDMEGAEDGKCWVL